MWDRRLSLLHNLLEEWTKCQRGWMYLSAIFGQPDIARQLPTEATDFQGVDKMWKSPPCALSLAADQHTVWQVRMSERGVALCAVASPNRSSCVRGPSRAAYMEHVAREPSIVACVDEAGALERFTRANATIERIERALERYLETKRARFPRLYFLSNDELLQILAQTTDPRAVQPYMSKCFVRAACLRPRAHCISWLSVVTTTRVLRPFRHLAACCIRSPWYVQDNVGSLVFKEDRTGRPEMVTVCRLATPPLVAHHFERHMEYQL